MKAFLTLCLTVLSGVGLFAQNLAVPFTCHTNDLHLMGPGHADDPAFLAGIATADAELEAYTEAFAMDAERGGNTYVIPVVFHIIHNNGPENITDEQVYDAMRVLNNDFNKLNTDWPNVRAEFLDIVADVGVSFELAKKDPQGNCTKGITRTVSTLTNVGDQTMKDLIQWPRNKYLNVWVCAYANGAAGYTYRPGAASNFAAGDGIVLEDSYTGSIGTSSPSRSRTLSHEVGHWINLLHTWGDGNDPVLTSNCNQDDNVSDTPNTVGWTSCNLNGTSCGSLDNVENYMDYSYCSKMFTNGQKTRMVAALNSGVAQRNNLWSISNLASTGVSSTPVLCAAEFSNTINEICAGGTVVFTDISYHNIISRTWSFPGGSPSSSSDASPVITYAIGGTYPVTLEVSDGTSTLSTTSNNLIVVLADPGVAVPFAEGFENLGTLTGSPWSVSNPDNNNTFQLTTTAAYTGNNSVRILNTSSMNQQVDELISSTYDMSAAEQIIISFRYAYAQRNASTNDDRLRLYVSNNCGASWSLRQQLRGGNDLNTAGSVVLSSFVPNADQWGFAEVNNISSSYHTSTFRIKFEFLSYGGNNLYIDDINLNGATVGIEEVLSGGSGMVVVPNPAHDNGQVVFNMNASAHVVLELLDVTGRRIQLLWNARAAIGLQRVELPVAGLRSGVYLIRLQENDRSEIVRFVVD